MRILIADDHDVVRTGLRQLLLERHGWEVCGEAKTGREAVTLALQTKPDVVVMDIGMPELNGLEAARQIRKGLPNTEIVILSLHLSDELVYEIVQAGVRGYVLKSDANRDLVNAVEALSMHRTFFTAKVSEMMLDGFCNRKPRAGREGFVRDRLTSRQREIVQLLAEGKSSKEVAVVLNISVKTAMVVTNGLGNSSGNPIAIASSTSSPPVLKILIAFFLPPARTTPGDEPVG